MDTPEKRRKKKDSSVDEVEKLLGTNTVEVKSNSEYRRTNRIRREQGKRSEITSQILHNYSVQENERAEYKAKAKPIILWSMLILLFLLTASVCTASVLVFTQKEIDAKILTGLISGLATYFASLLSILLIIVKYIFPCDEEKNFNELVKTIITNDTEQMKYDNDKY